MKTTMTFAFLIFALLAHSARADDRRLEKRIDDLNGFVKRNTNLPGAPIVEVELYYAELNAEDWNAITDLPHLVRLTLLRPTVAADSLKHLEKLRKLEELEFTSTIITNASLKIIARLPKLRSLSLWRNENVTDAGLKELRFMKTLQVLCLDGTSVTGKGLKDLAEIRTLTELSLRGANIVDEDLIHLTRLKKLRSLNLEFTKLSESGLKVLTSLPDLRELYLLRLEITDAGMKSLLAHRDLTSLSMACNQITDEGMCDLVKLDKLQTLKLRFKSEWGGIRLASLPLKVTGAGWKHLNKLAQLKHLEMEGVPPSALRHLTGLTGLRALEIGYLNPEILHNLRQASLLHTLPSCRCSDFAMPERIRPANQRQVVYFIHNQVEGHQFDDRALRELSALSNLEVLHLNESRVTDAGLKDMAVFKHLRVIRLRRTAVTGLGLRHLAGLKSLRVLDLEGSRVSAAGLKEIETLTQLQVLNLRDTRLSANAVRSLRKCLPTLRIEFWPVRDGDLSEYLRWQSLLQRE